MRGDDHWLRQELSRQQGRKRYVSAEQMETHLWAAVQAVLSEPSRVLADGARAACPSPVERRRRVLRGAVEAP